VPSSRPDLCIDWFSGVAPCVIVVDHVPLNVVSRVTARNVGCPDATGIVVFLSGCSAAPASGGAIERHGVAFASDTLPGGDRSLIDPDGPQPTDASCAYLAFRLAHAVADSVGSAAQAAHRPTVATGRGPAR
jgi:hypothetical protein